MTKNYLKHTRRDKHANNVYTWQTFTLKPYYFSEDDYETGHWKGDLAGYTLLDGREAVQSWSYGWASVETILKDANEFLENYVIERFNHFNILYDRLNDPPGTLYADKAP